jgi:hypothetical protein
MIFRSAAFLFAKQTDNKHIDSRYDHARACPGIMPWVSKVTKFNV